MVWVLIPSSTCQCTLGHCDQVILCYFHFPSSKENQAPKNLQLGWLRCLWLESVHQPAPLLKTKNDFLATFLVFSQSYIPILKKKTQQQKTTTQKWLYTWFPPLMTSVRSLIYEYETFAWYSIFSSFTESQCVQWNLVCFALLKDIFGSRSCFLQHWHWTQQFTAKADWRTTVPSQWATNLPGGGGRSLLTC